MRAQNFFAVLMLFILFSFPVFYHFFHKCPKNQCHMEIFSLL